MLKYILYNPHVSLKSTSPTNILNLTNALQNSAKIAEIKKTSSWKKMLYSSSFINFQNLHNRINPYKYQERDKLMR